MNKTIDPLLYTLLRYDAITGWFTWALKPARRIAIGARAGTVDKNGYVQLRVNKRMYFGHRLAWLFLTGAFPTEQIDHKNGVRSDNSAVNLRSASNHLNAQNMRSARSHNKVGLLGVSPNGSGWRATIVVHGAQRHLGTFATPEEAHKAYIEAKRVMHVYNTL
jgi:hypothetical protein